MNISIMRYAVLCTVMGLLFACKKKFDDYYERPTTLEPPIYQQLEARGNFTSLLAVIDKAGYKRILSTTGYYTFFAPHDDAFNAYLTEHKLTSVNELDSNACRAIVTYCLVYNAYKKDRLDDYQSPTGWVAGSAFKRKTANYTFVYDGTDTSGAPLKMIANNRNSISFAETDNNNKYIPYFVNDYMQSRKLTAWDYNYFYPNSKYTGFNVADAAVTEQDIAAENGVIHVIDKVVTALPSIDQYLEGKEEYSLFKSLLDKFLVQYVLNPAITRRYQITTGQTDNVYTKVYSAPSGSLAYSLNNENHLLSLNDAQTESYSIFVPTNAVLQNYINKVLLENYPPGTTLSDVPVNIVYDFINAHLWQRTVWPSKFNEASNFLGEGARFDVATDIGERKILSNGIFYGTKKVQEANVFTSVYGRSYLDPKYSMMTKLLNWELKSIVSDINRDFTLFMISDSVLNAAGFTHDAAVSVQPYEQYRFTPPPGSTLPATSGATTRNRLLRILNLHVVPGRVLTSLAGEGAALTYGGEYIGFKYNKVFSSGNVEADQTIDVSRYKDSKNGRVYYIDKLFDFSESTVAAHIEKLGTTPSASASPYNYFWEFLKTSSIYVAAGKSIAGVPGGTFYTLFIPDNAAIQQAVKDTLLPGDATTGVPNFVAATQSNLDKEKVNRFIYYHLLDRRTVAADGVEEGGVPTLLKTNLGDAATILVTNTPGSLMLTDSYGRTATVISSPSTFMGNRIVIHLINNYLKYSL
ncbi:fasciclin domain-containing protein [Niastella sp. OAS944]|uniref:fasciclin domain-containing protein n=1 Tax=Niastella sp. OAS944 TaxID=2664089 RepID=UPI00347E27F3|nr:putative surface protein with fasciclin (FAS1) repeats [Chitinophagaceae bacterium OAS944]